MLNQAATIAFMTETHGTAAGTPDLPHRVLTVNQIAAWNVARYRKLAGYTQEMLGAMIGRTTSAVSDAERSWDSGRTREFDAQLLTEIALALGVPVLALLLPPAGDGIDIVYEVRSGNAAVTMAAYMELAVDPDPADGEPAAEDYRDRYTAAVYRYLQPEAAEVAARWMGGSRSDDDMAVLAERFRDRQREALEAAAEWGAHADALEREAQARGDGQ